MILTQDGWVIFSSSPLSVEFHSASSAGKWEKHIVPGFPRRAHVFNSRRLDYRSAQVLEEFPPRFVSTARREGVEKSGSDAALQAIAVMALFRFSSLPSSWFTAARGNLCFCRHGFGFKLSNRRQHPVSGSCRSWMVGGCLPQPVGIVGRDLGFGMAQARSATRQVHFSSVARFHEAAWSNFQPLSTDMSASAFVDGALKYALGGEL
jgi:hypothetical protein